MVKVNIDIPTTKLKTRPPYDVMVKHSIYHLTRRKRKGTSRQAVLKFMGDRFELPDTAGRYVSKVIRLGLESNDLTREKLSYKLADSQKRKIAKEYKMKKRRIVKKKKKKKKTPKRIWQFNDQGFYNYDLDASKEVEKQYKKWKKDTTTNIDVRSVKSGKFHYMVNFRTMKQTNIDHDKHTQRDIRRAKWKGNENNFKLQN